MFPPIGYSKFTDLTNAGKVFIRFIMMHRDHVSTAATSTLILSRISWCTLSYRLQMTEEGNVDYAVGMRFAPIGV